MGLVLPNSKLYFFATVEAKKCCGIKEWSRRECFMPSERVNELGQSCHRISFPPLPPSPLPPKNQEEEEEEGLSCFWWTLTTVCPLFSAVTAIMDNDTILQKRQTEIILNNHLCLFLWTFSICLCVFWSLSGVGSPFCCTHYIVRKEEGRKRGLGKWRNGALSFSHSPFSILGLGHWRRVHFSSLSPLCFPLLKQPHSLPFICLAWHV